MARPRTRPIVGLLLVAAGAEAQAPATAAKIEQFLKTAAVVEARPVAKGIAGTWRLTLSDGAITHDASFQSIDERATKKDLGGGRVEVSFVDSYRYNIAAYRLARLLGLDDMVPVSVERKWRTKTGAFTWWVDDVLMDEGEMIEKGLKAPDQVPWQEQIFKVRLFSRLTRDTDRNRGNLLITSVWRIWMIDFTRAFRRWPAIENAQGLERCDRHLLQALRELTRKDLDVAMKNVLTRAEIEGVIARRDLLLEHFEARIRELGEAAVLY